jgi:hypothetical protein
VLFRSGDPTTGLSAPVALPGAVAPIDALVRDFDADGDADVLLLDASATAPAATLFRNDGGPSGAVVWTPIAQPAMTSLVGPSGAAGRFDADAYADVAWGGAVFLGSPSGVFVSGPPLTPALSRPCAAGDLDGDGLDDLFESCGARRPCLGGGAFGAGVDPFGGAVANSSLRAPTLLAWDRDGDLDAMHRLPGAGTVLLTNLTRQLARGAVARPARTASLELFGAPGGFFTLFASTGPAALGAGPWGTVLIDPANAVLAAFGAHPATGPSAGRTSLSFAVPNSAGLVGLSLYWQAVDDATFHVTNRLVTEVYGF